MRAKRTAGLAMVAVFALGIAIPSASARSTAVYWTTAKAEARAVATLRSPLSAAESRRLTDAIQEAQDQQRSYAAAGNTAQELLWANRSVQALFAFKKAQRGVSPLDARCIGKGQRKSGRYASFDCIVIFPTVRKRIVLVPTGASSFR